ncbi:MAG: tetratricopeptide repeat protein [Pseudomonadota bacterium]
MTRLSSPKTLAIAGLTAVSLGIAVPAFAAGGGSNNSSNSKDMACPSGQVFDRKAKAKDGKMGACVSMKDKSASLTDQMIYDTGEALALAGRYEEAIDMLTLAANRNDPRILNYLGFSHRKLGRVEVGMGYYREALRIDPGFTLARSYMGEAFLMRDDVPSAREQLDLIASMSGTTSTEYQLLSNAIDAHLNGDTAWN